MSPTRTIHIEADTSECEAALERCITLAERFHELWGDLPVPDGIERLAVRPGDVLVLRYDGDLDAEEAGRIKADAERVIPEVTVAVLTGGIHVETVLGAS